MGPRAGLDGRKISSPPVFFFLNLSAFIPVSIYNNCIVLVYQQTLQVKAAFLRGQYYVLYSKQVSNQLWKDIHTFR